MTHKDGERVLWGVLYVLEHSLLLYLVFVPYSVYTEPGLWAVEVSENPALSTPKTVDRPFIEAQTIAVVTSEEAEMFSAPVASWKFYVLGVGFVFVKMGRIGFGRSYRRAKNRLQRFWQGIRSFDR